MLRIATVMRTSSGYHSHRSGEQGKDGGGGGGGGGGVVVGTSETTTNSGSNKHPTQTDDDEEEDEPVYVESSPCSRWQKRRETVSQRDIPGIDASYLAMDTEEGVEVVWNEVLFSERKISDIQHNKVSEVFDKLIELSHMNIVKFHGYWQDRIGTDDRPRVVFITEYMSSGSLKTFLRKTKKTKQNLSKNSWRRWCIQLLSALNYLHSCEEPIIHGNLTCDTVFIQNTGLLKIGSIAPDVLHRHVKSISDSSTKHLHFQAPEIDAELNQITTAVDIYSLGMVTLEMINLDLGGNGDTHAITPDVVNDAIDSLDNRMQQDLVLQCLESDPSKRPTARELLFHPALFEIPSLKLLAIHSLTDDTHLKADRSFVSPAVYSSSTSQIFAELESIREGGKPLIYTYKDCPPFDLDKLFEDVQNGLYPITAYHLLFPTHNTLNLLTKSSMSDKVLTPSLSFSSNISTTITNSDHDSNLPPTDALVFYSVGCNSNSLLNPGNKSRANAFERTTSGPNNDTEHYNNDCTSSIATATTSNNPIPTNNVSTTDEKENRRIIDIQCKLKTKETGLCMLLISVKFQDRLQRDMTAEVEQDEGSSNIAKELLTLGLIHESDYTRVEQSIDRAFNVTIISPDVINGPSAPFLDARKPAGTNPIQALQTSSNGISLDGHTTLSFQPVMFLPT